MRIQSPFHDYYDSALGHGADPTVMYLRTPRQVGELKSSWAWNAPSVVEGLPEGFVGAQRVQTLDRYSLTCVPVYLALAGSWRVLWSLRLFRTDGATDVELTDWSRVAQNGTEASAWLDEVVEKVVPAWKTHRRVRKQHEMWKRIDDLAIQHASEALNLNRAQGSPVVALTTLQELRRLEMERDKLRRAPITEALWTGTPADLWQPTGHRNHFAAIVDLPLRLVDLQKSIDPYTLFQSLAQCLSGVLGSSGRPMVQVSDKTLLAKHGFDPRYGFRHRP